MSKVYKYTCNHVYKKRSLLPGTISIDDICPYCKQSIKKLHSFYAFEDELGLNHFDYTLQTLSMALTASQTRFELLHGYSNRFIQEKGLLGYLEGLYVDSRPQAKELIRKTVDIINEDMEYWYSQKNKTCDEIIKHIEIGEFEDL